MLGLTNELVPSSYEYVLGVITHCMLSGNNSTLSLKLILGVIIDVLYFFFQKPAQTSYVNIKSVGKPSYNQPKFEFLT